MREDEGALTCELRLHAPAVLRRARALAADHLVAHRVVQQHALGAHHRSRRLVLQVVPCCRSCSVAAIRWRVSAGCGSFRLGSCRSCLDICVEGMHLLQERHAPAPAALLVLQGQRGSSLLRQLLLGATAIGEGGGDRINAGQPLRQRLLHLPPASPPRHSSRRRRRDGDRRGGGGGDARGECRFRLALLDLQAPLLAARVGQERLAQAVGAVEVEIDVQRGGGESLRLDALVELLRLAVLALALGPLVIAGGEEGGLCSVGEGLQLCDARLEAGQGLLAGAAAAAAVGGGCSRD